MIPRRGVLCVQGALFAVATVLSPAAAAEPPRPVALRGSLAPDGASVSVQITVVNPAADRPSAPGTVEVYLSGDGLIDDNDARLDRRSLAPVVAGGRVELHIRAAVPPRPPGRYYLVARVIPADPQAPLPRVTDALWGAPLGLGPDLTIDEVRVASGRDAVQISGRVQNRGTQIAPASAVGASWTTQASGPVRRAPESAALPELLPGHSARFELSATAGDLSTGEYGIVAEVDPDQRIAESDEDNNQSHVEAAFRVGPDLLVADLSARQDGATIVVRDTVFNQGNREAVACGILFFLSRNGVWDAGDVSLGYRLVPVLPPGTESRAETRLPLPSRGLATARYFLIAKVDGANTVVESQEANNLALAPSPLDLRIGP